MDTSNNTSSYLPKSIYDDFLPDLDMFSRLPSNTFVHLDRNSRFIPTGMEYSSIFGVQTFANLYKGHNSEELATKIDSFIMEIIKHLNNHLEKIKQFDVSDSFVKSDVSQILYACRSIERAITGSEPNGGIEGLLSTYASDSIYKSLKDSIQYLKVNLSQIQTSAQELDSNINTEPNYELNKSINLKHSCPEEFFEDYQWEGLIKVSSQLKKESPGFFKYYAKYSSSLLVNDAMQFSGKWNWWDKIIDGVGHEPSLFLGALPLVKGGFGYEYRNDLKTLKEEGIGAVLSVTEVFENNSEGYHTSPISPDNWKENGIKQLQLPTPDFENIPLDFVQRGVEYINWNLKNGRSVYVHCKAGRGRSALITMCYLIKYKGKTAEEAYNYVQANRKQVVFSEKDPKRETLREFENIYCNRVV